ncbi:MAG: hypothetical protein HY236_04105 [Acidobacteria bacterium]|nr:hypothetical protein [Acidobacteriota bacterium]
MERSNESSRRGFLTALAGAGLVARAGWAAGAAEIDKDRLPLVSKRLEKAYLAPGKMPNGLQAVGDGLWILDQEDQNKAHKVRYEDGTVLAEIQTESLHGSGITYGGGALWIASTYGLKTLKVDPATGRTLASFDTPGVGLVRWGKPTRPSGAHGLEWVEGKYWIAAPPAVKIYLIEPETGKVLRSIPSPGVRPHGLAWVDGYLWCVESNDRAIYKLDPEDGRPVAKIQLRPEDPEPHGMTYGRGMFWYCDAASRWVCRLI